MKSAQNQPEPELVSLDSVRVETALSRYPVHRLAKRGTVTIELREQNERGVTTFQWKVSHNSAYGQPGPLAYKVDTLVINKGADQIAVEISFKEFAPWHRLPRLLDLLSSAI
jgi:hypothetical protein